MCKLNDLEIKVLKYHKQKGCDYSKSLAKALNIKNHTYYQLTPKGKQFLKDLIN